MQNSVRISCEISTTDESVPLGFEIWLDDQQIFNTEHVAETVLFDHDFQDTEGDHQLKFVLKNKTINDTRIDASGQITADARIMLNNLAFDNVKLGHLMVQKAQYQHDFNGTGAKISETFYGVMGCNGQVTLQFTSPVYLWLLEHM